MPVLRLIATIALLALATAGCSSNSTPTTPLAAFEPEIINAADAFQFQATVKTPQLVRHHSCSSFVSVVTGKGHFHSLRPVLSGTM